MKTNRGRIFPYETGWSATWRGRPPHLTPNERSLMFWWLDQQPRILLQIWYDVRMDGVPDDRIEQWHGDDDADIAMRRAYQALNSKRCDAIVKSGPVYQIVELRIAAGAQTLGELVQYSVLARAEWPTLRFAPALLVTTYVTEVTERAIRGAGFGVSIAPLSVLRAAAQAENPT